ncbi:MAG: hypothetical protein JSV80_07730, partial [Acidobacteriota bacterium]
MEVTYRRSRPTIGTTGSRLLAVSAALLLIAFASSIDSVAQTDCLAPPGGSLCPTEVEKFVDPLIIPPVMPLSDTIKQQGGKKIEYYEIAVRQFDQLLLPSSPTGCAGAPCPQTTVWSYGSLAAPGTVAQGGTFNYPALTIEAKWTRPVRVKWVNDLVVNPDTCGTPLEQPGDCNSLPHLLPVDQTLHW